MTTVWVALVLLIPSIALACPYCAGRNDGNGLARGLYITTMVAMPFLVVGVAYRVMRRSGLFQSEHTPIEHTQGNTKTDNAD